MHFSDETIQPSGGITNLNCLTPPGLFHGKGIDFREYIDCRPIVPGESILVITMLTQTDKFSDQIDPLLELVGLPAAASVVIVEQDHAVAFIAAGEPVGELAAGMQEIVAMAGALAGAYRRFK